MLDVGLGGGLVLGLGVEIGIRLGIWLGVGLGPSLSIVRMRQDRIQIKTHLAATNVRVEF